MQLDVKYNDKFFVDMLIYKMKDWFNANFDSKKLTLAQEYVDSAPQYKSIFIKKIDLVECCYIALNNLKSEHYSARYVIRLNDDVLYGTTIKLKEIINLITYGNLVVKPYPIFVNMFNFFQNNIDEYYNEYIKEN